MKDKDLRRLNRKDLLEIVTRQQQEIERLESKLQEANAQLEDRCIRLDLRTAGSVGKAIELLTGILKEDRT